ncbi:MAG TPA: GAF domain-containing protein, partial [Anaerolineales bacterium]|nr:GAF domain-containing protein [Anaerolineales bacterium]
VYVPIIAGENVLGVVSLQSYELGHIFPESDVRLLETLTNSMSVALQNAQSFKAEQERVAELQIINSIQQGLAAELDFQSIVDLVGDKLREVLKSGDIGIRWYDSKANLLVPMYDYEHGKRLHSLEPSAPGKGGAWNIWHTKRKTKKPVVFNTFKEQEAAGLRLVPGTDPSKSRADVPIIASDQVVGGIVIDDFEREFAFGESELRLLTTIAASLGTALENARLFDETQRLFKAEQERVAELQIINSIQQGLAAELDFQAIVDLVGNKLSEVLQTGDLGIRWYDEKTGLIHHLYEYEHGERLTIPPLQPRPGGVLETMIRTRQPIVMKDAEDYARWDMPIHPGTDRSKSAVYVPIISSDRVLGFITLENYERENAYGESELRLLTTIAASLGTALENARLFDETQRLLKETEQHAAELAIINSVQEGLASKLDYQGIIDLVGNKIREIFNAQAINIAQYDAKTDLVSPLYLVERDLRHSLQPMPLGPLFRHIFNTRESLRLNTLAEFDAIGAITVPGTEVTKSGIYVPLIQGGEFSGIIALENLDHEHAFTESDLRLLTTLANSMSVALENARLFDETQRLLRETEQRAAELAIINSVQQGLASKLEIQAVYDLVGNKIRDIFQVEVVYIAIRNPKDIDQIDFPYYIDRGTILKATPLRVGEGLTSRVIINRQPLLVGTFAEQIELGAVLEADERSATYLGIPIIVGDFVAGVVSVQSYRENAFNESDIRLLTTLASSMGVALENARLFDETQRLLRETEQHAAELAIINSVQEGLASRLDMQAIYELVGEKIRDVFDAQVVTINTFDIASGQNVLRFGIEKGKRFANDPYPLSEGHQNLIRSRQPLLINQNWEKRVRELGFPVTIAPGTEMPRSSLFVPLIVNNEVKGSVSLQNVDREHAFSESDVRLLQTLANSMSVALENARLFDETQRLLKETEDRAAELAIINSVQQGLASKLEMQEIYELVGDKISEVTGSEVVVINTWDVDREIIRFDYIREKGKRLETIERPFTPLNKIVQPDLENGRTILWNSGVDKILKQFGHSPPAGEMPRSVVMVPLKTGQKFNTSISLQNISRENAFSRSDIRLIETLASSMSVALENAHLFDETQRLLKETEARAQELSAISTVSQALVAETELDNTIQLIGSQMLNIFDADIVYVALLDRQTNLIHFPYQVGETFGTLQLGEGLTSRIIRSGEPLLINKDIEERRRELGTTLVGREALSYLGVPVKAGGETIGVLSVQSTSAEGVFDTDDLHLLETIAANAGAAIQTAQLHAETQRRALEMTTLAEIGNDIAASRDLDPVLERIAAHAKDILRVRDIAIVLREPGNQTFSTVVAQGRYVEPMMAFEVEPGRGIVGTILQSGVAEFVNDPMHDPRVAHIPGTPVEGEETECLMGAPLISRGETIGGIMVWRDRADGIFTQSDLDFLVSVARQTAIAIESARLYLETQRRAREMSALVDVGRDISASLEPETVLESIATHARNLLNGTLSAVFLPEGDGKTFRAIAAVGEEAEHLRDDTITMGQGILGNIARNKFGEIVNDVYNDPRVITIAGTQIAPDEHLLAVPLLANDELKGIMSVWRSGKGREFSEVELEFLNSLARQAVIAVQNSQLFTEVKETLEQQTATREILSIIAENPTDIQPVLDAVAQQAARVCNSYDAVITRIEGEKYRIVAHWGPVPVQTENSLNEIPLNRDTVTGRAMVDKKTIHVHDLLAEPPGEYPLSRKYYRTSEQRTMLVTPLIRENEVIGSIMIRRQEVNPFTEKQIALIKIFADQAAIAIENVRLFNELQRARQETEESLKYQKALSEASMAVSST